MAVRRQVRATGSLGENSPLLGEQTRSPDRDDGSSETVTEAQRRASEEELEDSDKANQHFGRLRAVLIMFSLWGLIFLQASNMSGITTTQSRIAEDLDAFAEASWFTSTYLIAMSSCSPLAAKLAEIFSPRNCVFAASILFAVGDVITSQAHTLLVFLLGRAIQGIASAGIMTTSYILVLELSGKKKRGLFIGLVNTGFTTGVSFGAVIAGALLPRFLFWIQSPLAIAFGTGIYFSIPGTFTSGHQEDEEVSAFRKLGQVDYLGATTLTTTLCLFLYGLSSPVIVWTPIAASVLLLVAFVLFELYLVSEPIIPVTVLKSRGALLSCVAQLGIMAARWMVLFYTPAYAIAVRGWSPASAGSILIPTNLGFAIGGICAGGLHIRRAGSFWLPSLVSYLLFSCTLATLSQITNPGTPTALFVLNVFANGLCTGAALNYTLAHLLHLTPPSTHFISTSLITTFRGFAGSFGSAIGGGLFVRVLKSKLETGFAEHGGLEGKEDLVRRLLGSPALVQALTGLDQRVAVAGYVGALRNLFVAGAGLALAMVLVQAATGWEGPGSVGKAGGAEEAGQVIGVVDEEWEERMEQGV
ncbi:putative MFS multidrug transporter [Drepanopeziza brunnea f. sp. 'multigermtubi' MB_m1]|uniref:Putative MFS multidrug transporter n=1 Tax=Marssonina brunnea f. sp. multigermtubi (strain MB_m1) TaxID=1072389 RepID=K1X7B7_MARBU|nr:putative MFS multidrug transporter [Drepanopeziza brunnea f. sp. 'multigermtubi' MB_m1]EKD16548.1 putative MFS multidrug transporter [Drepanopeziza brunnea f. sp. 'multigermtubi' MB_m1]